LKYILTNKVGYDLREAIENPTFENAEIVVLDPAGIEIDRIPVTPLTLYMYNPEPDPRYQKPEKIVTLEGEIEIPTLIPEDSVTTGENPFIQIIYRFVKRRETASLEDIVRHITTEKKLLPNNDYGIGRVISMVKQMHDGVLGGLLIKKGNLYMTGMKLKTGRRLIKIYPGYDPFEYYIIDYFSTKGTASKGEIHTFIMDDLKWARQGKLVDFYLKKLEKQGNIKRIGKEWYAFQKSLEPF